MISLGDLLAPGFAVLDGDRRLGADALEGPRRGRAGYLVVAAANTPREALGALSGAWSAGAVPLLGTQDGEVLGAVSGSFALRTSGSTGAPRVALFGEGTARVAPGRIASALGLVREDVVAVVHACDHGYALLGQVLAAGAVGATVATCRSPFADGRAEAIDRAGCTVVFGVPERLAELCTTLSAEARGRVRLVGSAGGPLRRPVVERVLNAFPDATLWNQYGCTEAGPRLTCVSSRSPGFAEGAVGRALPGVRVWIEADGGIAFASDVAMLGYVDDPAATEAQRRGDGWSTGDLGRVDAEGNLFVEGRVDDLVKVRGVRVSLEAVAAAAMLAGASDAIAVLVEGDPDRLVLAYEGPLDRLRFAGIVDPNGMPAALVAMDLPRLASGKLDRVAVRLAIT